MYLLLVFFVGSLTVAEFADKLSCTDAGKTIESVYSRGSSYLGHQCIKAADAEKRK